jgi:hypothetical protein
MDAFIRAGVTSPEHHPSTVGAGFVSALYARSEIEGHVNHDFIGRRNGRL